MTPEVRGAKISVASSSSLTLNQREFAKRIASVHEGRQGLTSSAILDYLRVKDTDLGLMVGFSLAKGWRKVTTMRDRIRIQYPCGDGGVIFPKAHKSTIKSR